MSAVFPPTIPTTIMVSTLQSSKIIYLPAVSTLNLGKLLYIKDANGNAFRSSIFVSTTGLDTFDYRVRASTISAILSTNYASLLIAPDGGTSWLVLQYYTSNAI